jgi:hypothetical protein
MGPGSAGRATRSGDLNSRAEARGSITVASLERKAGARGQTEPTRSRESGPVETPHGPSSARVPRNRTLHMALDRSSRLVP